MPNIEKLMHTQNGIKNKTYIDLSKLSNKKILLLMQKNLTVPDALGNLKNMLKPDKLHKYLEH